MKHLLAAAAVLLPTAALACPVCAAGDRPYATALVGAMIVAPYLVAALVIRAVRSAGEDR